MNVKGLKISDILDIGLDEFNKLKESDLRHLTSRLVSASNKRIRRLQKHNLNTPAYQGLGEEKAFSTKLPKGTSRQQRVNRLRAEFSRARNFLASETSTIAGYRSFVDRTEERIARELGISKDVVSREIDVNRMFDILHRAQSEGSVDSYRGSKGSIQGRKFIAEKQLEDQDIDSEDLMSWLDKKMEEYYENREKNGIDIETDELSM